MRTATETEMIFLEELNWENLLKFAAQFFGLVLVARWIGDTPDEKVILTIVATVLYAAYLLFSIIRTKHLEKHANHEETHVLFQNQIEETKKATVAYRNVNEKLTTLQRKYDGLLTKLDGVAEQRDVYKELVSSAKASVDESKLQIKNVTAQRDELLTKYKNDMQSLDELRRKYKTVKQQLDEMKRYNDSVESLRDELKSVKNSRNRLVGEIRKHDPNYGK